MECEIENCENTAKYQLYKSNGEKKWIHVCKECEGNIGFKNLQRKQIYDKNSMRDSNPGKGKPTGE